MEDQGMLSMVSNITTLDGVPGEGGCSDSNSSSNSPRGSNKRQREETSSSSRFKGVFSLNKGKWGAQIYVRKYRYWLGTFESESDAAMAYDSATVYFRRSEDSPRNYPPQTSLEPDFQNLFQKEELLSMLRDGIYQTKFNEFVNSRSLNQPDGLSLSLSTTASANDAAVSYQKLFQKELTPSDVSKLNRLVINRRFAEKYFPEVSKEEKHPGVIEDIQLSFFDREMKRWTFRYCYWRSSQSYVFTRGWNRFVKDKKLEAKDMVTFYKCQKEQNAYYMIDVAQNGAESNGGTYAAGSSVNFGDQITVKESTVTGPPQPEGEVKKAVRLFGVNIS
ncbi:AP2/ERF and B3 domain-containing transcription factor At1g50680-like [Papaver somniferum]|uniref:AP2/ERF and B3 domain-containing transcription factor At1g50680-like n=1 Tax=Papaver somniferum TaxID=3469 RepID=UPI000E6FAA90|nr:AP2/ERF and B3 domain-containing transcription factor At1g50680-like [Papaver somniferum]